MLSPFAFIGLSLWSVTLLATPSMAAFTMAEVSEMKLIMWDNAKVDGPLAFATTHARNSSRNDPQKCTNNSVTVDGEEFPCENVDFLSFVSIKDLDITGIYSDSYETEDIWGWQSPEGREITILCMDNGIVFIDSTNPVDPIVLAKMESGAFPSGWCDAKVYRDVLYVVKDSSFITLPNYGIEVFNLTRLVGLETQQGLPISVTPDFVYGEHDSSHNLVINPDTGFLYSVGTRTCRGGLHMIDLNQNPLVPSFVGCASADGYTHDAQCVLYDGPDSRYTGDEVCFAFNEDTLTIWNVTDKSAPVIVARMCYPEASYTHQGWLTDDLSTILLDDEIDEICAFNSGCRNPTTRLSTTTIYVNVTDLENPFPQGLFEHPTRSVDHNLYVWGSVIKRGWTGSSPVAQHPSTSYAYLANYVSGLRVADISQIKDNRIAQAGFFEVSPDLDGTIFFGAWSTFMHPSGVIAVSTIERGLFFLNFTKAFVEPSPSESAQVFNGSLSASCDPGPGPSPSPGPGPGPGPSPSPGPSQSATEAVTIAVAVTGSIGGLAVLSVLLTNYFKRTSLPERSILDTEKITVTP